MQFLKKSFPLAFLPTPLVQLKNLQKHFPDYSIFLKRDDLTGLALGGNKTRKLEFLIFDALQHNSDCIITAGAQQSNHCRQTAAASAIAGLECHLLLGGNEPEFYNGNLLLDKILNANIHFTGEQRKGESVSILENDLKSRGKDPYVIPYGGSNSIGALGFVKAVEELLNQMEDLKLNFDYIFFASSSGGTQAGILVGAKLFDLNSKVIGINIDKGGEGAIGLKEKIFKIAGEIIQNNSLNLTLEYDEITVLDNFDQAGYGNLTNEENNIIKLVAASEGVLLDAVYTARAFNAMTVLINAEEIPKGSRILFWHTGGIPANFLYGNSLI